MTPTLLVAVVRAAARRESRQNLWLRQFPLGARSSGVSGQATFPQQPPNPSRQLAHAELAVGDFC